MIYLVPISDERINNVLRTENFELLTAPTVYVHIPRSYPKYAESVVHGNTKEVTSGNFSILELLDANQDSVGKALDLTFADKILSVASSKMRPIGSHTLLIRKSSGNLIVAELTESQRWSIVTKVPRHVRYPHIVRRYRVLDSERNMIRLNESESHNASQLLQLQLSGAVYARAETHILLLWGNCLLISTNSGKTLWIVQQSSSCGNNRAHRVEGIPKEIEAGFLFAVDPIVSVTSSQDGRVAAYTKSGRIWIGDVTQGCVMPLALESIPELLSRNGKLNVSETLPSYLFFNELDELKVAYLAADSTSQDSSPLHVQDVESLFPDKTDGLQMIETSCPVLATVRVEPDTSQSYRRSNVENEDILHVFLDHSQQYTLRFEASLGVLEEAFPEVSEGKNFVNICVTSLTGPKKTSITW